MPQVITWRRTIIGGNASVNPTFVWRYIITALDSIAAYKDVVFRQVTSGGANITFACVNYNTQRNALAWHNSGTIYIPSMVNWGTWYAGMFGMPRHEVGHRYSSVGNVHGTDGVMRASLSDPLGNFTPNDFTRWYLLPDRGGIRPWQEPNRWRTIASASETEMPQHLLGFTLCCHLSAWRKFMHIWEKHEVKPITDND